MKLNIKVMFIIAAIYHFLNGLMGLVVPPQAMGVASDAPGFLVMTMRFWGVASLALGLIAWLVRNAEASKTRDALTLGMAFFFILEAPVSVYGHFVDPVGPHLVFAFIEALIAVGFIIAGRAGMSKNAS